MLKYNPPLKTLARNLRTNMTDAEQVLWSKLRRKQIHNLQFYRQRPVGKYIVDFQAPAIKLIIEVDGSQHDEPGQRRADAERSARLAAAGYLVLRYDNRQVLLETDAVMQSIHDVAASRLETQQVQTRAA